jgi:hypothetical protein
MTQTKGEYRVGISFNPSNDDMVSQIKQKAAELIDLIDSIEEPQGSKVFEWTGEVIRLKAQAQREIEAGAMWAVKAATKPKWE